MARNPWKWLERANLCLIKNKKLPKMPDSGVPDFTPKEFANVFRHFSSSGEMPLFDGQQVGDHFDLMFLPRVVRQTLAVNWFRLSKQGTASSALAEIEEFNRLALIYQASFNFTVLELKNLHEMGVLIQSGFDLALSRQAEFLMLSSRELSGKAADLIDGILPKKRGPAPNEKFDAETWQFPDDGKYNQREFAAWASHATMKLDGVPVRTAIKCVLKILDEHGEVDGDLASHERAIARILGQK